jgi:hypothetical protein
MRPDPPPPPNSFDQLAGLIDGDLPFKIGIGSATYS